MSDQRSDTQVEQAEKIVEQAEAELDGIDLGVALGGTPPPEAVNPDAQRAMKALGIDETFEAVDQGVPEGDPIGDPEPPDDLQVAHDEITQLKQKLGQQGAERGGFVQEIADMKARLDLQEQTREPQVAVSGKDIARELMPGLTDEDLNGDLGSFYEKLGTMQQNAAMKIGGVLGQQLEKIDKRLDTMERGQAEATAEMSLGGVLDPKVKQELNQEFAGLEDVKDPFQKAKMTRTLLMAMGKIPKEGAPVIGGGSGGVARDPARHVGGVQAARPHSSPKGSNIQATLEDAIGNAMDTGDAEALSRVGKVLSEEMDGNVDLGTGLHNVSDMRTWRR